MLVVYAFDCYGRVICTQRIGTGDQGPRFALPHTVVGGHETLTLAARRLLLDSTGFAAPDWTSLGAVALSGREQPDRAHIMVASNAGTLRERSDDDDNGDVALMTPNELRAESLSGRVTAEADIVAVELVEAMLSLSRSLDSDLDD